MGRMVESMVEMLIRNKPEIISNAIHASSDLIDFGFDKGMVPSANNATMEKIPTRELAPGFLSSSPIVSTNFGYMVNWIYRDVPNKKRK